MAVESLKEEREVLKRFLKVSGASWFQKPAACQFIRMLHRRKQFGSSLKIRGYVWATCKNDSGHAGLAVQDARRIWEMQGCGGHAGVAAGDTKSSCPKPNRNEFENSKTANGVADL